VKPVTENCLSIEQREIGGQVQEVCRIFDMDAKTWRDASTDEINKVRVA
jgi:hypothetical protein